MIVNDLDVVRIGAFPPKVHAPLVVDSNAVLPLAITAEFLQAIPGRHPEILERFRSVDSHELAEHDAPEVCWEPSDRLASEQAFGIAIAEGLDHQL